MTAELSKHSLPLIVESAVLLWAEIRTDLWLAETFSYVEQLSVVIIDLIGDAIFLLANSIQRGY